VLAPLPTWPVEEIERVLALGIRVSLTPPGKFGNQDSDYVWPLRWCESLLQQAKEWAGSYSSMAISALHIEAKPWRRGLVKLLVGHGASIRHGAFHLSVHTIFAIIKRPKLWFYGHPIVLEFSKKRISPIKKKGFESGKQASNPWCTWLSIRMLKSDLYLIWKGNPSMRSPFPLIIDRS